MNRPFKYFVLCDKTKKVLHETDTPPVTGDLMTYEPTEDPNTKELKQTRTAYIDTRYDAKLRLWRMHLRKRGIAEMGSPFKGTDIGKNIPILGR